MRSASECHEAYDCSYISPKPTIHKSLTMLVHVAHILVLSMITTINGLTIDTSSLILPNVTAPNITNLGAPFERTCNGRRYGWDLQRESCADAIAQIDFHDQTEQTYARRSTDGSGTADVNLPRRYISCK